MKLKLIKIWEPNSSRYASFNQFANIAHNLKSTFVVLSEMESSLLVRRLGGCCWCGTIAKKRAPVINRDPRAQWIPLTSTPLMALQLLHSDWLHNILKYYHPAYTDFIRKYLSCSCKLFVSAVCHTLKRKKKRTHILTKSL